MRNCGFTEEEIKNQSFEFTDDNEIVIARHLAHFSEVIEMVTDQLKLNLLCNYLYELATKVAESYSKYRINNNEKTKKRAALIMACKKIMGKCFDLLGIKTIDKI